MKKKSFVGIGSFLIGITTIVIISCSKSGNPINSKNEVTPNPIVYYSSKFLNDDSYVKFATTTISNNLKIGRILKNESLARLTSIDSNAVYNAAAENVTAEFMLEETHPSFASLTQSEKYQILNNIKDSLKSVSYRQQHPTNPLIVYELATIPQLHEIDSIAVARFAFSNISSGEFWGCATATIGSGLAAYGDILGEVRALFSAGGSVLGWGDVFSIAWRVVKNASAWWKVAGLALEFGGCLWSAGLS
ncbi:MAG: hypothetical protein JST23_09395 [Bacteroidetes bacterium]|nr:hypothetical protein [Bacteroidota bacterium]